jgi:hypothetical protein
VVLDESGFATVPNVPRAGSPTGEPRAADAGVTRHRLNVIGVLDEANGEVTYALSPKGFTSQEVMALIEGLAASAKAPPTLVVFAHARIDHSFEAETVPVMRAPAHLDPSVRENHSILPVRRALPSPPLSVMDRNASFMKLRTKTFFDL